MELTEISALGDLLREGDERKKRCDGLAITLENARQCEAVRTENNKFIKGAREAIDRIKDAYLKPLNEKLKPYEDCLDGLSEANKDLSKRLLETSKERFRQSLEAEFREWGFVDEDGEVASFEEMWDPSWASKTKAEARKLLLLKLNKWKERGHKRHICVFLEASDADIERLRNYLKLNDIQHEIDIC